MQEAVGSEKLLIEEPKVSVSGFSWKVEGSHGVSMWLG